jgi:DNA-binding transcriptional LysR family regulator
MFENLDEIYTFVRVVDAKSLSAAARSLHVSVNAVWSRLERIERRAGARLIERTTRSLRVTEAGERVARRARRILEELQAAERDIATGPGLVRGTVRVAVSPDVADGTFLADLRQLLQDNPELRVELIGRSRLVEPVAGGVDIIVWAGPVPTQTSTVRKLGRLEWVLGAAPSYVALHGAPVVPEDLACHDCLLAIRGVKESSWTLLDGADAERKVPVRSRFESDASEILSAALYAGLGIGIRPLREVRASVATGRLVHVLPAFRFPPLEVSLVAPTGRLRSPHVRVVADLLTRRLRWLADADG